MLALYQPHFHTLPNDLLEQLLKQLRLLKPSVPVLREGGVMRDLLIETQAREPAPRQAHAQLLHHHYTHQRQPMGSVHLERVALLRDCLVTFRYRLAARSPTT